MADAAKIIPMARDGTPDDGALPPSATDRGGAPDADPPRKREKRKKRFDTGRVARLFNQFAYQYGSDIAWDTVARMPIKISALRHTFGNDEVRIWMGSEKRRMVMPDQVVFDPSMTCDRACVNLFGGYAVKPNAGDVAPVLDLLNHLVDQDETISEWILDWVAYPLQHAGSKMPSAIIMHGDEGSGKNLFWENCVMALHGEYGTIVGQAELESKYNAWMSRRTFVIGDEVLSRQEMRAQKGKLKSMVSGKFIQIEDKFMPLRMEENHVNMVFLSNELQPNALDASDRRYLVCWTPPKKERAYYQRIADHMRAGGLEAFLDYLLKRDLSRFDPYAPPPRTKAKADLIELGRPNPERFWMAWMAGDLEAPFNTCSADQVYRLYRRWCLEEGERYPMSKPVFARMVQRVAGDALHVRRAKLSIAHTVRMWLCAPPPDEVDFAEFARGSIDTFEQYLHAAGAGDA